MSHKILASSLGLREEDLTGDNLFISGFAKYLLDEGHLSRSPQESELPVALTIDHMLKSTKKLLKSDSTTKSVLLRMEPKVVMPNNYDPRIVSKYDGVISVGRVSTHGENCVLWPMAWPTKHTWLKPTVERLDRVVLVNSNKFSFVEGELYSLRRLAIKEVELLDVAGFRWSEGKIQTFLRVVLQLLMALKNKSHLSRDAMRSWDIRPKNFVGEPSDKLEFMSNYRIALVIENDITYMSEKLFDAFFAGCIPIYVGPPLRNFGIYDGLVIEADSSVVSINNAINKARAMDQELWREKLNHFLAAKETQNTWSEKSVYKNLVEDIFRICI